MVGLSGLWMPIVLSAVLAWIASSIVHMVLKWHNNEYKGVPQQDALADAMRPFNLQPGEYMMPWPSSMKEMGTPEFMEKRRKGPVALITVLPSGPPTMGKQLGLWFVLMLVVSAFTAYVAGRTLGPGAPYLRVFRIVGAVAFGSYAFGHWQNFIWWGKGLRSTITNSLDGLIYALVIAGTFGWLWPR